MRIAAVGCAAGAAGVPRRAVGRRGAGLACVWRVRLSARAAGRERRTYVAACGGKTRDRTERSWELQAVARLQVHRPHAATHRVVWS